MSTEFVSSAGLSSVKEPHLLPQKISRSVLAGASEWLLLAAVAIVPLAFFFQTSQSQDFIKQVVLLGLVSVAVLCWVGSMLVSKSLSLRRTVANPLVLVFLATVFVSALLSKSKYIGLVGSGGQEYLSFMTTLLFAAFFFVVINLRKGSKFFTRAIFVTIIVGGLVSLFSIFQYAGVSLIPGITEISFNMVGSTVVLGLYAAAIVVMSAASFLVEMPTGKIALAKNIAIGFFGVCAIILAAIIDFWPIWTAIITGLLVVLVFAIIRPQAIRRLGWLVAPMIALVIAALLLIVNVALPINAPIEVFPSFKQSFNVAVNTLVSHPIFGAGPGTFNQEFALHRALDLNQSPLWYVQFDRGTSFLTTIASGLGVAGLVAWLAIIVIGICKSVAHLFFSRKDKDATLVFGLVIFASWLAVATGIILYGASFSLLFLFWLLFAVLVRMTSNENVELSFHDSPRSGLVLTFSLVILIVLALAGWFICGTRLYADASFVAASAVDAKTDDDAVISGLESALRADPQSDAIARNLSQAYLIKIQQLFSDTKMDATAKSAQVQNLTASAIKAATAATQLGVNNIVNWTQLGVVYEAIAPYVFNASDQAIAAYQHAADLDPTSPVHPTSIGRVYLSVAGASMNDAKNGNDESAKADAQKKVDDSLTRALASLEKALSLKSDYAPASYQIALAYDAKGSIKEAISSLQGVIATNPNDLGVAFEMASLYYRDNQKDKAQSVLEGIIKLEPAFANARWLLASIYEENNKFDEAIEQVEEILKTNADNEDVKNKLQALRDARDGKALSAETSAPATLP